MKTQSTTPAAQAGSTSGLDTIARAMAGRMGFLNSKEVATIAADPLTRLTPLLVRCGGGRFTAPAQDVQHFIDIISQHNNGTLKAGEIADYVRDVSIPASQS